MEEFKEFQNIELDVEQQNAVFVYRQFFGKTTRDKEIENLPIPEGNFWLGLIIRMIRYYQLNWSTRLGNRCVFDPSCSHYAELAFREKGLIKGVKLTVSRLIRCRPNAGGKDDLK